MAVDKCIVCNSPIWSDESLARGYGSECAAAIDEAKFKVIMSDNNKSLNYNWLIKVKHYKALFVETFKDTKFRKEFKKNFYASICKAERISKKQLDIMISWLEYTDVDLYELSETIKEEKRQFIKDESKNIKVNRAMIETARRQLRGN